MDARWVIGLAGLALSGCSPAETAVNPEPPLVQVTEVAPGIGGVSRYTGTIRARTESNLGFGWGARSSSASSIRVTTSPAVSP